MAEPMTYSLQDIPAKVVKDYATTISILDHLSDAIFMVDKHGVVQYANKRTFELLKVDIQGLRGRMIDELFPQKLSEFGETNSLVDHFKNGHYSDLNTYIVFQDISIPVHASFSIVKTANGDIDFIIVSVKDMTIQKSLEKELRNQQIMSISRDRIRALGELSVSLVHELSQPLASLQMRLELLQNKIQGDETNSRLMKHFAELDDLISRINNSVQVVRTFAFQSE
ncbi:MAG TPA: PAS domain S-box protein, partial [Candidatus Marinimicrobia bacterium]|nr:PAS domain S-box protein [Candidatus Neomarinimicrobiota bacterium]